MTGIKWEAAPDRHDLTGWRRLIADAHAAHELVLVRLTPPNPRRQDFIVSRVMDASFNEGIGMVREGVLCLRTDCGGSIATAFALGVLRIPAPPEAAR